MIEKALEISIIYYVVSQHMCVDLHTFNSIHLEGEVKTKPRFFYIVASPHFSFKFALDLPGLREKEASA